MMKTINIIELNNKEFDEKFLRTFGNSFLKRNFKRFYRGFICGDLIYIRKNIKVGRLKLIAHEMGHAYGKNHTWLPTTMNPYWIFRWF